MSDSPEQQFLAELRHGLRGVDAADGTLLAVSGGADSMALLLGMLELREERPGNFAVGHFNHQLRGDDSAEVAHWLGQTCANLGVDFLLGLGDVAARAAESGRGIEETAREARYEFLRETAAKRGWKHILVAHTADDQIETILHHLLRGTGIAGLRGMPRRRKLAPLSAGGPPLSLVRPLLGVTRTQVAHYLRAVGQEYREDPTNADAAFTRNRIRHELLPLLEASFNPRVREAVANLGRQAAEVQEAAEFLASQQLRAATADASGDIVRLHWQPLRELPRHVIRECFALLWKQQNWPRQRMNFAHYERLADLVTGAGGALTLPGGIDAERRAGLVVIRRRTDEGANNE